MGKTEFKGEEYDERIEELKGKLGSLQQMSQSSVQLEKDRRMNEKAEELNRRR